jgi:hypothetical protein
MTVANTLAYYVTATITVVKCFEAQTPDVSGIVKTERLSGVLPSCQQSTLEVRAEFNFLPIKTIENKI